MALRDVNQRDQCGGFVFTNGLRMLARAGFARPRSNPDRNVAAWSAGPWAGALSLYLGHG